MIRPKDAAAAAMKYYRELNNEPFHIKVEEVEFDDAKQEWIITLGMYDTPMSAINQVPGNLKVFRVNGSTGEVTAMKIHEISKP